MLTVNDLIKDYEVVMTSVEHIQEIWASTWHQKEFMKRRTFAFTVISLDESKVLGAVYVNLPVK